MRCVKKTPLWRAAYKTVTMSSRAQYFKAQKGDAHCLHINIQLNCIIEDLHSKCERYDDDLVRLHIDKMYVSAAEH